MKKVVLICSILILSITLGCSKNDSATSDELQKGEIKVESGESKTYDIKWGTSTPISFDDQKYGLININSYGNCSYKIINSNLNDSKAIEVEVVKALTIAFERVITDASKDFYKLSFLANELEAEMLKVTNEILIEGVEITSIEILSIDLTDESRKKASEIDKQEFNNRFDSNS